MKEKDIERALKIYADRLMNLPNVVGLGIQTKVVAGQNTSELCLVVYVSQKLSADIFQPNELVPGVVILPAQGQRKRAVEIKTDVVEVGEFTLEEGADDA